MTQDVIQPVRSLYVHVPFCAQKCSYCAFYSEASQGDLINRFVDSLVREIELVAPRLSLSRSQSPSTVPATVFFGGGTPSILNLRQWQQILKAMERHNLLGADEWTIECNPATVSLDKAKLWRDFGVNRISMGVQSLDEGLLDRLGRIHSRDQVFKSFDILRQGQFRNINVDLMFAIPGQSLEIWQATLREALALESEHLSSYEVIYEDDTPLFSQMQAGEFSLDEDLACAQYEELLTHAAEKGFQQYEVANFAKGCRERWELPEYACRHNVNYWQAGDYFGLGPSAANYVQGVRSKNWSNTQMYCEQLDKGHRAVEWTETLPTLRRAGETAAFGLRMASGWRWNAFRDRTGFDLRLEWKQEISDLVRRGWGEMDSHGFRLTREGMRFADAAAEQFLK